jgi:hypothetical protein
MGTAESAANIEGAHCLFMGTVESGHSEQIRDTKQGEIMPISCHTGKKYTIPGIQSLAFWYFGRSFKDEQSHPILWIRATQRAA